MTLKNNLDKVNANMEERAINRARHKVPVIECESLEETVKLLSVDANSECMAIL